MKSSTWPDSIAFAVIIAAILLLTVLGAGTMPYALNIAALAAGTAYLVVSVRGKRGVTPLACVCSAAAGFVVLTALPVFPPVRDMNRDRSEQNSIAAAAVTETADLGLAGPVACRFSLSRNRAGTLRTVLLMIAAFAAAATTAGMERQWRERTVKALIITGFVVAAGGFISQRILPQGKHFWWLIEVQHGRPAACFVNRNHFGGFIAMLCPAALILFGRSIGRKNRLETAWLGLAFVVMSLGVAASLSRGAWVSYAAAMIVAATLFLRNFSIARAAGMIALAACTAMGIALSGTEDFEKRMESLGNAARTTSAEMRMNTWHDSLKMFPDYPIAGIGADGFRTMFGRYRTADTRKSFTHAENEYVQLVSEGGIAGIVLAVGVITMFTRRQLRSRRPEGTDRNIELSAAGAIVVAAIHAAFDFPLHVPLYAIALACMTGMLLAQSGGEDRRAAGDNSIRPRPSRFILPVSAILCVCAVSLCGKRIHAQDNPDCLAGATATELCEAVVRSPTYWHAWYHLGRSALASAGDPAHRLGERCIAYAATCDPNNYRLWRELSRVRLGLGDRAGAENAYARAKELRTWISVPELDEDRAASARRVLDLPRGRANIRP